MTRVGRISAPLRRRRRKASRAAAGDVGVSRSNVKGNGNGVAPHRNGLAHDDLDYDERGDVDSIERGDSGADTGISAHIEVQEAALA